MGVIPTAVPQLDDSDNLDIGSMSFNSTLTKRALAKRDIPLDDTGDWATGRIITEPWKQTPTR